MEQNTGTAVLDRADGDGMALRGAVVGELVAMVDGRTPLVVYGNCGSAAVQARTVVDLHGEHVGARVVLLFEGGNPERPIIMGVLVEERGRVLPDEAGHVTVDADGDRLVVSAAHQLVLRCGRASITLTKTGKVLIRGTYLSSRASGVNRIKGGSVQLN